MKATSKINKFLKWGFLVIFIGLFAFIAYYNYTLQNQVIERDRIIRELAFSDSLVSKYFDVKIDTLQSLKYYTLKEEYGPKEIHHYSTETIKETHTEFVEDTLALNLTQSQLTDVIRKYDALVGKYNILVNKVNTANDLIRSLSDSLQMQRMALGLIKRNFDIDYTGTLRNGKIVVEIASSKADSAFMILPYYREKLRYNTSKNIWEIKK